MTFSGGNLTLCAHLLSLCFFSPSSLPAPVVFPISVATPLIFPLLVLLDG